MDRPGILLEEDSMVEMHFVDHEKSFTVGEQIKLTPHEIYSCIVPFVQFGISTAEAIERYGRGLGLGFTNEAKGV